MIRTKGTGLLALVTLLAVAPAACSQERDLKAAGPAAGGAPADFQLLTYGGDQVSLHDYEDRIVVLEWFAHNCEFTSSHYKKGAGHMQKLQSEFGEKGVVWLTIDSNQDALAPAEMQVLAKEWKMQSTAFLSDPLGAVGRAYGVTNTPQMFVIQAGKIVYQGAIDDRSSFFGLLQDRSTARNYVRQALEELLAGAPVSVPETKPYGCKMNYAD